MRTHPFPGLLLGLVASASCLGFEPAEDMQSAEERATETAPGVWHGQWTLRRAHPALRTLGASTALNIEVWHSVGAPTASVQWSTGPAICPRIEDEACEWVGAYGSSEGAVIDDRLYFALPLSADSEDPLFLHLPRPGAGRGAAVNAKGGIAFALEAEPSRP
ncbi:hypothetical protein [Aquimonas voraii]|uniref:Uncharacterized protein n=1 Tax=Aquimonas voraii TaxID=265719 RepID=A0A1G6WML5_9GAMM|nr:hypothetical protein [Aquimonas voraii]SDD67200.1 hypothetical protein SAMN04488509_10582 [Aquimonas voraii]